MFTLIITLLSSAAGVVLNRIYEKFMIAHDNPMEESIEDVIKDETGLDLDFTPESKE